jgi:UDP-N-acetylmuramate--alanine ligase
MRMQYSAVNVRIDNGSYIFDVKNTRWNFKDFRFGLPGNII